MAVEPAQLVLGLLAASEDGSLSAATLTRAAELFDFAPGTIRVAVTRLKQRGTIRPVDRGVYALTERGFRVRQGVSTWRDRGALTMAWSGDWLALSTAGVSRSDRREVRRRERELERWGFAPSAPELWIRADNRRTSLSEERTRVETVAPGAPLFVASDFPEACVDRALKAWDPASLEANYRALTDELRAAEKGVKRSTIGEAAAVAFDVGDRAIRAIVADPLLPAELVDAKARQRFFDTMVRFDEVGRRLWQSVLSEVTV